MQEQIAIKPDSCKSLTPTRVLLGATIKDGLVYLPAQVLPSLLGLISVPIFTRIFTPEQYGQLAIVGSTVSFMLVGTAWGHESAMRFYAAAERDNDLPAFYGATILSLLSTLAVIGVVGGLILSHLPAILPREYLGFAIVIFVAEALFKQGLQLLRVAQKAVAYTALTVSFSVAKLALSLLLVFFWQREIASLLWAWVLTDLLLFPFIAERLSLLNHLSRSRWSSVKSRFGEFITYGMPFVISSGAWASLSIVDRFVIQHFRGSAEVGLYYVGSVPNLGFSFIFTLLAFASYPIIVDTWEKAGSEPAQELIKGLLRLYFMLSVPLVVVVSILSKEIIAVLAAPQYLSAYKVVPLVALGGFFQGLLPFTTKSFVLLKKPALNMAIGLVGAISTILLNILFISSLGFLGAGLAMSISYLLVVALSIVISKQVLHFSYRISLASLGRICLGSLIIIPGVAFFSQWYPHSNGFFGLAIKSLGGILIYFMALLTVREVSLEELLAFSRLLISKR